MLLLAFLAGMFALPLTSSASDVLVFKPWRYLCTEGDPRCDFDSQANGRCTFRMCEGLEFCDACTSDPPVLEPCTTAEEKYRTLPSLKPPKRVRKLRVRLK